MRFPFAGPVVVALAEAFSAVVGSGTAALPDHFALNQATPYRPWFRLGPGRYEELLAAHTALVGQYRRHHTAISSISGAFDGLFGLAM